MILQSYRGKESSKSPPPSSRKSPGREGEEKAQTKEQQIVLELMKHRLLSLTDKCPFSINESTSEAPSILDIGPGGGAKLGLSTLAEIIANKEYEDRDRSQEREKTTQLQANNVVYSSVRHSRGQL